MADVARIRDLVVFRHCRRDESECVAADVIVGKGLLDLRHVAGDTLVSKASGFVAGVLRNRAGVRSIGRAWTVALQA